MKRAVYFDLDGTLTDSGCGICNAIVYLQEKMNLKKLTDEQLRSCIGPPLPKSFMRLWNVDSDTAEKFLDIYREYYVPKGIFENSVYPGIKDVLMKLTDMGYECRTCSAKPETMVNTVLEHFGIKKYFSSINGASLHGEYPGKGAILKRLLELDPAKAVMVGDRRDDIEGGVFAGIPTVGVLWGYGSREELESAGASFIAENTAALLEYIDSVFLDSK